MLTQLTTGGKSDAEIATPIIGPAAPRSKANATPVPDVSAQAIPIHSERALPLIVSQKQIKFHIIHAKFDQSPSSHFFRWPITQSPRHFGCTNYETKYEAKHQTDQHSHEKCNETFFLLEK